MNVTRLLTCICVVCIFGCNSLELKENIYYWDEGLRVSVILTPDSVFAYTPSFVRGVVTVRRYNQDSIISFSNGSRLVLSGDSAYFKDHWEYKLSKFEVTESPWDSIVIDQIYELNSELAAKLTITYENISILGLWVDKEEECPHNRKFAAERRATALFEELDRISPNTFDIYPVYTGGSTITYLVLKKCLDGNCIEFRGDDLAAGYPRLYEILNYPYAFTTCVPATKS